MKSKVIFDSRKIDIFIASILILIVAYTIIKFIFPGDDPLAKFLSYITSPFLILIDKFVNIILHWTGSALSIQKHSIYLNGILIGGFTSQIMYKKVTAFCILVLWFTRATAWKKIYFTGIYLFLIFISASIYIVTRAYYIAGDSINSSLISNINSIVFICMNTILLIWYLINKKFISDTPSNISFITKLLERKLLDIIIILYGYSIVLFSIGYFSFKVYINFLIKSSQGILGLLGYDAVMEPFLLIGDNGSISVYRTCLGFMTMFLFASFVYLTGSKQKRMWGFIILGLLILNLANILRIVLLFIHIQKHGDYKLATDIHDIYNYIIYSIVFVLWVIWFERFMLLKTLNSIRSFLKK